MISENYFIALIIENLSKLMLRNMKCRKEMNFYANFVRKIMLDWRKRQFMEYHVSCFACNHIQPFFFLGSLSMEIKAPSIIHPSSLKWFPFILGSIFITIFVVRHVFFSASEKNHGMTKSIWIISLK